MAIAVGAHTKVVDASVDESLRALEGQLTDIVHSRSELGPEVFSILLACWFSALECVLTMHGLTRFDIDGIYRRYRAQAGRRADA